MPATSVKLFQSTDSGATVWTNTAGKSIEVLDACLVNGYGSVTLDSLVVSSDIATGTLSTGHGFTMAGLTGPVIVVAGATPSGLNGEWRVASIADANTFTFATTGISDQTASGTITAKRAGAGWAKLYSGTNKAVYQRTAVGATVMLLRVDDTPATYPALRMYEAMTDVDTGTGASAVGYATRPADTGSPWMLIADEYTAYFCTAFNSTSWTFLGFGDFLSYVPADAYHAFLRAGILANSNIYGLFAYQPGSSSNLQFARASTQSGAAIPGIGYGHPRNSSSLGSKVQVYPAAADGAVHTFPVEVWDDLTTDVARGIYPGFLDLIHATPGIAHGTFEEASNGRTLYIQRVGNDAAYAVAFDVTGPWR